uniref:Uncharacterized protein n=1 Tax=Rhizophora mucronata TaxID=61149 RepID=A0A2P2M4I1_RHIMU
MECNTSRLPGARLFPHSQVVIHLSFSFQFSTPAQTASHSEAQTKYRRILCRRPLLATATFSRYSHFSLSSSSPVPLLFHVHANSVAVNDNGDQDSDLP